MGYLSRHRGPKKRPIEATSKGHATHNMATQLGELRVTIYGTVDKDPGREVRMVLDEASVYRLAANLRRFDLL